MIYDLYVMKCGNEVYHQFWVCLLCWYAQDKSLGFIYYLWLKWVFSHVILFMLLYKISFNAISNIRIFSNIHSIRILNFYNQSWCHDDRTRWRMHSMFTWFSGKHASWDIFSLLRPSLYRPYHAILLTMIDWKHDSRHKFDIKFNFFQGLS